MKYDGKIPHYYLNYEHNSDRYAYDSDPPTRKIEIIPETGSYRTYLRSQDITDRIFADEKSPSSDPLNFAFDKSRIQYNQLDVMLGQLTSRYDLSRDIRKSIEYEEVQARSKLRELTEWPSSFAPDSRLESELVKQLQSLNKDRWAEEVSCWRDTTRILSNVFEHWSDYSDESRKARLLNLDY